ncbi:P-loop containing nucleoside triphosphate hydrolase protein [Cucurbitaria berberidis CBS 394.84]|uniref:Midasin n=1 Tax=Cucurbitaria berberidis CBS 394.84 TaxID=1168544 RepID=A0A9P4GLQ4_9PLEO|nr:P-loop containing nucleoside triphosphate hydrolase protein [Cucurbitaria berberidis CBS 394.84]KAF1847542.1 P-loop containing nucleoside triphosphate hydrolase protein [Cucurbitaria berberidis CBS 394.84]
MIKRFVGEGEIEGPWEDQTIDYRFLSLWEEKRWKDLQAKTRQALADAGEQHPASVYRQLSPYTVNVSGILLPRLDGEPSQERPSDLISTATTEANLKRIAYGLLGSSPLLLTGLAGSGKTLLTRHFAWQLNKLDKMLLIGIWRAGVLTTADLDRAPNERGELLIPSRGETVRAARGFRIIATMRSSLNLKGQEIVPRQNMIGHRFWKSVPVQMPQLEEFKQIISAKYPLLQKHLSGIIGVYSRLLELYSDAKFSSENGTSIRAMTPRDLLKWCDRIAMLLAHSPVFSTAQKDDIFMEAFDCFAGSLRSDNAQLHIDPQRRDHLLKNRTVKLSIPSKTTAAGTIQIGRARLSKHRSSRRTTSGQPFSTNDYTLQPLLLYLAEQLGRKLVAFNLSQQSESGDLLGGFKPVNVRSLVVPLKDEFDDLFDTTFSRKKNLRFIEMLGKRVAKGEWKRVSRKAHESQTSSPDPEGGQPKKRRKMDSLPFSTDLHDLEAQLASGSEAFAFSFLEGNIVKAVRNGDWVLLDEINLASSDTLEALTDLLGGGPDGNPSILLTETGNVERVVAHPNFRVFAAMNPATDVGKKDLSPGIRSRFTEFLRNIVEKYLGGDKDSTDPAIVRVARDVTSLYLEIQQLAKANMLVDGADQKPHFSLRTLTRTLSYAKDMAPLCSLRRALYEGFHMSFMTFLGKASEDLVAPLITKHLFPQKAALKAELGKPLQQPSDGRSYVGQGHYWLRQGVHTVEEQPHYIITPFVQRNMNNLIRASSTRKYPVLIQGPTSSGKTSMIEYLAKRSGNKFVRINNHEHTDLQEYLGSYISGTDGKLVFQEGILVRALREAPTDVLEALNRLLDDNRELLIPETQEVVRPHEDFMLFATQNPAGLYGGRKVLSRAFRNRFLELHFDDIPVEELTEILHRRTMIPETWCKRIVKVYRELSTLRQENRIFEQKSFATLRDLFRWAQRNADTVQDLANNGYMLLAERVRKEEERVAVKKILETVMSEKGPKVTIDEDQLFSMDTWSSIEGLSKNDMGKMDDVVWTRAMRRLFALVAHALRNNEPVLLIGETGCGKTTVCQLLADQFENQLHIVNAHQNTETGDLIGAQRPIRNRAAIEELVRNQVLKAIEGMENENIQRDPATLDTDDLLAMYDKIDHEAPGLIPVTEREMIRNNRHGSLVHAMRQGHYFLLDEISLADDSVLERLNSVLEPSHSFISASDGFQFLATMNPGGDYGKKELSPALRNRFTEIWVPAMSDLEDILQIIRSKLRPNVAQYAEAIVSFSQWFNDKYNTSVASSISIRDTLSWISFINKSTHDDPIFGIVHGAAMVFIDTLGANPAGLLAISATSIDDERRACLQHLSELLGRDVAPFCFGDIGSFSIPKFSLAASEAADFSLDAPTTRSNAMRIARALQLVKPILLEGNPGVGKTTLPLTRLNLSEQTDLMDLFGSDVPVEGGAAGTFAWRDAPFLKAMKNGDWSVLEGLNAVLDHRGEHQDFRVFAAQNPHHQGGGRKGLPASFVNRFTVVYADVFRSEDLTLICRKVFPGIDELEVTRLIQFIAELDDQVFNLRDTLRWLQLLASKDFAGSARDFLETIFVQRFRAESDRSRIRKLFEILYGVYEPRMSLFHNLSTRALQVGLGLLSRDTAVTRSVEAMLISIKQDWPVIVVGSSGSGKTAMINQLASLVGADVVAFPMNADVDAMDLVGGYEQVDATRELHRGMEKLETFAYIKLLEQIQPGSTLITSTIDPLLEAFHDLLQSSNQQIDGARFQWQGKWIVLDNANLCSSAVLDRLNSLLEPNGYLSINEHSTADGEARIVRPHPDFKIFMTMDPRFAVEICLLDPEHDVAQDDTKTLEYPLDSAMYRFRYFQEHTDHMTVTMEQRFENLGSLDNDFLTSFTKQVGQGLVSSLLQVNGVDNQDGINDKFPHFVQFLKNAWAPHEQTLHPQVGAQDLAQLVPYHPLGSELSLNQTEATKSLSLWSASMYGFMLDLYNMQQRRKEKQKLPAFLYAYWQGLVKVAAGLDVAFLKPLRTLFWGFFVLATGATFDRAMFQTYESTALLQNISTTLSKQIAVFGSDVQLTTGLGMERTQVQLKEVLELEGLADRLDIIMWKSNLRIDEMVQIRERVASSLELLIIGLNEAILELNESIGEFDAVFTPYLEAEFEGLCQFLDVAFNDHPVTQQLYITPSPAVVATRTKSILLARRPTKLTTVAVGRSYYPTDHFAKLYRYLGLTHQSGGAMALQSSFHISVLAKLYGADDSELGVFSQQLSLDADRITQDHSSALDRLYYDIYNQHIDRGQVTFYPEAPITDTYRSTLQEGFEKCYRPTGSVDANAWIQLGLFGLTLYVPNYPHDPALRPMVERKMFNEEKQTLLQTLASLKQFQIDFTGQDTSFRIRQIEEAIQSMGEEPPVPPIVRPERSELDDLQGEFTNLLSTIQPLLNGSMSAEEASRDITLQQNVLRISQRLTEGYRAYDDITDTVVGFLVCLEIGLVLGKKELENEEQGSVSKSLARRSVEKAEWLLQELEEGLEQHDQAIGLRWNALHSLTILKSTDPASSSSSAARTLLHDLFLLQDQEKQAKDSSLYTYRGMDEDDEEEDPTLFPDYEAEQEQEETSQVMVSNSRDHAIRLASMHAELFRLLQWCAAEMNRVSDGKGHGTKHEDALPTIYLALEKRADTLSSSGTGKSYNFYFDANLQEAKRLITLIYRIQIRYRQIHTVWPEHMTLSDVLRTCDEALEFRHVDPVAKLITKWQKVASKDYSTANLWRQLELTTWARLFDLEIEKAHDDAKTSESISDENSMKLHALDLVKTLESFFDTTTLGQFEQRIKLLQQLRQHAAMRMQDALLFKIIYSSLDNFIAYFSRLEKPVHEALAKGRQSLEKEVNNALKQSAKTSHRKLSKWPVSGVIKTGFPEELHLLQDGLMDQINTTTDALSLELCAHSVPGWTGRPIRFRNLEVTVNMMRSLSMPRSDAVESAAFITDLITDLTNSMLTEENKETVQHLKTQKRKLYADTMKTLRQMGVNSNPSVDTLVKQDTLSTILTSLPFAARADEGYGSAAEYYLHKALNIMPQVRAVYKEHSGYIEGLLHISIRQRGVLIKAAHNLQNITAPISIIQNLSQSTQDQLFWVSQQQLEATELLQPSLRWLAAMLKTGTDIVSAQAKLGKTNELGALIRDMHGWTSRLQTLADSYERLPKLPAHVNEANISELQAAFQDWIDNNNISRVILRQIRPFLFNYPVVKASDFSEEQRITLGQHTKDIFSALDLILGSMQDVEAALNGVPASTEDAAWLVKEEQALSAALNALHAPQISRALQALLDRMQYLHDEVNLQANAALYASIQPIFNQYVASHKYLIQRFDALHASAANLLHRLSKSFIQIGTQGFCQPPEKSADQQQGKDDKLESGTGLGEGEDDEDLEDLAQEESGEREGSIEEEDDAVDMGEQEMEDKGDESGDEGDDDVQSEVGSVDDLGPSAVDEKMWDEGGKQDVGTEDQEEQVAAEQKEKEKEKNGEDEEKEDKEDGEDQEENVGEEETLDLPEDLNMDGQDDEGKEDDDLEDEMDPETEHGAPDTVDEDIGPEQEGEDEKDTTEKEEDDEKAVDDEPRDAKDTDQADPNADAGAGTDANEEAHQNKNEKASASAANQDEGQEGESSEDKQETAAEDGQLGQTTQPDAGGRGEQPEESRETQSFKKLGDEISEAREKEETQVQQIDKEIDMADADFEHLGDEETQADTQALGTANEEQAKALDHDMAMPDIDDDMADADKDVDMEDVNQSNAEEGQPQAFVGEQKPFNHGEDEDMEDASLIDEDVSETSSIHDVETQLELTHLEASTMTPDSARSLWLSHEAATHSLSQQLTEHLRLILAPTLATKLRGDFRTGKRLNLKRIIPYIASGYKRDKIWLRRSQPSKRSYQVMIALDDSKSMAESGASNLALKTLTLVTKSLSMLEVGEVSVVGFGDQVNVAHDFDKPFTSDAGVRVFEQFGFDAAKTNVRGLVDRSLELFAEARRKGSSSAGEDLWQLMLVVSDGICDSHTEIQRLIRKAQEERVMIVFIIIDSSATTSTAAPTPKPSNDPAAQTTSLVAPAQKEKDKTSILDLQSVEITPEGKVVRWKYMERFPFRYYLVVRDVRELPGVLAGALRQWFGEVAGSA